MTQHTSTYPPKVGEIDVIGPGIRSILAPNPSPMTFHGTHTYVLGTRELAIIDPGPKDQAHLDALLRAIQANQTLRYILVTHTHLDHSPLARALSDATGAPILGFGRSDAGRSERMMQLALQDAVGESEATDDSFEPDQYLRDADRLPLNDTPIDVIWTPGHMGNHLSFAYRDALFCGDLAMGWSSSLISPPNGDLGAYFESCAKLHARPERTFYPAHGAPLLDPKARIEALVAHRHARSAQILASLATNPKSIAGLLQDIYREIDPSLHAAAARNLLAHLIYLEEQGEVIARPSLSVSAVFERAPHKANL